MTIMTDWIIPIIAAVFILFFTILAGFGVWKFIRSLLPKELNSWIKFSLLRKDYPEDDVAWCNAAHERGATVSQIKMHLLMNGVEGERLNDTLFIYRKIIKLKGGVKSDGRQTQKSSLKTFGTGSEQGQEESEEKGQS